MALFEYLKQTQRFLRDSKQEFLNPNDLISAVNRARREIAMRAQAIRVLTPISGQITGWSVTNVGAGYTNPVYTITPPDFPSGTGDFPNGQQATATGIVQSGTINAIFSQIGGSGYFQPQMTITDPTGSGATAVPQLSYINQVNIGQETYDFEAIDLSNNPGCEAVYYVRSVSLLYSNYRFSLPYYPFTVYQAMIRQYPYQYQYIPTFFSQFSQGARGVLYMYPLPSQQYAAEYDCLCTPSDLTNDQDYEALPAPWTEAVPYFAAHLAYLEIQNLNSARFYLDLFDKFLLRYSQYARIGRANNPYGRW